MSLNFMTALVIFLKFGLDLTFLYYLHLLFLSYLWIGEEGNALCIWNSHMPHPTNDSVSYIWALPFAISHSTLIDWSTKSNMLLISCCLLSTAMLHQMVCQNTRGKTFVLLVFTLSFCLLFFSFRGHHMFPLPGSTTKHVEASISLSRS